MTVDGAAVNYVPASYCPILSGLPPSHMDQDLIPLFKVHEKALEDQRRGKEQQNHFVSHVTFFQILLQELLNYTNVSKKHGK